MSMPEEWLAAAESFVNEEFNSGVVEAPQSDVEPDAAPETDTPELKIDAQGRAHGPDGKFVGSAEEEITADAEVDDSLEADAQEAEEVSDDNTEEDAGTEVEDEILELEVDDPEVLAFLDKYDGDVVKALKAAQEAQSLIGRQGNELGELRELREQFEAFQETLLLQQQGQGIDWEEAIDESPEAATLMALRFQNQPKFEEALTAWSADDPLRAFMFLQQANEFEDEPAEPDGDLATEVESFKQRNPDFQTVLPSIQELAAQRPVMQRALNEGTPQERALALEDLYQLAKSRTRESETSTAARKVILRAKVEADKAKSDAAVVGASRSSAVEAAPTGDSLLQKTLAGFLGDDSFVIE